MRRANIKVKSSLVFAHLEKYTIRNNKKYEDKDKNHTKTKKMWLVRMKNNTFHGRGVCVGLIFKFRSCYETRTDDLIGAILASFSIIHKMPLLTFRLLNTKLCANALLMCAQEA